MVLHYFYSFVKSVSYAIGFSCSINIGNKRRKKYERFHSKKVGFFVTGIVAKEIESSWCEEVLDKLYENYSHEELSKLGTEESVGVCYEGSNLNKINYMVGYIVSEPIKAKEMWLDSLKVEEREYAVLELEWKVPDCIPNGWKYAMEVFFPEHGYRHSGKSNFE